jgi:hypothetical protein
MDIYELINLHLEILDNLIIKEKNNYINDETEIKINNLKD